MVEPPTTPSAAERAALRTDHAGHCDPADGATICWVCGVVQPCVVIRNLTALERAEAVCAALEAYRVTPQDGSQRPLQELYRRHDAWRAVRDG